MSDAQNILTTIDLNIGYKTKKGNNCLAQNLNLNFKLGELTALVGGNGVGKSTLLRTLTGIQPPLSGTISLNDENLKDIGVNEMARQLSLVLTESLPPSNLTVFELVALGRQPYTNWIGTLTDTDILQINTALELTQISHLADKKHFEISDGQLQKVLIARALAQDTPLIILDEPTTHLDLLNKVSLFRLLKKLAHETRKCILFSTHDIDLAIQLSDSMVIMTAAEVIQDEPCQLIQNGAFDHLFADENISFDIDKGKFIFKNL